MDETSAAIVDKIDDIAEAVVPEVVEVARTNPIVAAVVAVAGLAIGGFIGYKLAEKKVGKEFDERFEKEIEKMKEYSAKKVAYSAKKVANGDAPSVVMKPENVQNSTPEAFIKDYNETPVRFHKDDKLAASPDISKIVERGEVKVQNIFVNGEALDESVDYDDPGDGLPRLISSQEFDENLDDYEQIAMTYFEGDGVLIEQDSEREVENVEDLIGEDNLHRFGANKRFPNTIHIRNDEENLLFEITLIRGRYSKHILGFDDTEE